MIGFNNWYLVYWCYSSYQIFRERSRKAMLIIIQALG